MVELKIEANVKGLGIVKYIEEASWDEVLEEIDSQRVISARNLAFARIQEGYKSSLSKYGSYIAEGDIMIPKQGIFLIRNSPLLQLELAREAVQSHENGEEYYINKKIAEEYREKASTEINSEVFSLTNFKPIKTNEFNKDKRALWLFQNQAEEYGKFLYDGKITEMPLWFNSQDYINKQSNPFLNQLRLLGLDGSSGLAGDGRDLGYGSGVFGVFEDLGKAQTQEIPGQRIKEAYTTKQIIETLKRLKINGLESSILDDLRKHH